MPTTMTRTFQAYTFDELSDRAKDKVRDWLWEGNDYWWESTFDDFKMVAACFGIEISTSSNGIDARQSDNIWFSSYPWGAGYSGRFRLLDAATCEARIKAYCEDEHLMKLAAALATEITQFAVVGLQHIIESGDFAVGIVGDDDGIKRVDEFEIDEALAEEWDGDPTKRNALASLNTVVEATVKDLARWLCKQLEAEEEYQRSDEAVRETCEGNEYRFEEDGSPI